MLFTFLTSMLLLSIQRTYDNDTDNHEYSFEMADCRSYLNCAAINANLKNYHIFTALSALNLRLSSLNSLKVFRKMFPRNQCLQPSDFD